MVRSIAPGTSRCGAPIIYNISYAERQRSPDGALCATYGATPCWKSYVSSISHNIICKPAIPSNKDLRFSCGGIATYGDPVRIWSI